MSASSRRLAQQIFDRFDKQIVEATVGTPIAPRFIAGLIGNEAGKDKQGNIVREATRFEAHVYRALISIRDNGYRISKGVRVNHYNRIVQRDIHDASDEAIRALATSYDATQIMGWHVVRNLHCTIADLRNPDKHFFYTVKLLQLNGYVRPFGEDQMDREMREWNTGLETGRTYHPNYVPNARTIRAYYAELERGRVHRTVIERVVEPVFTEGEIAGLVEGIGTESTGKQETAVSITTPPMEPSVHPVDPANGTETPAVSAPAAANLQDANEPAAVTEPEPYNGVGFWATIKRDLAAVGVGNFGFESLATYVEKASGWPEWVVSIITKAAVGVLVVSLGYLAFRVIHFLVDSWKKNQRTRTEAEAKTAIDRRDIVWVPPGK